MENCQCRPRDSRVTVVFVSHNSSRDLARALDSLRRSAAGGAVRILVVENGAEAAAARAVCDRSGAELVVPGRNLGYGPAANQAAGVVTSEYLAVANPDVVFGPETLRELADFLDRHPDAGVVAPQLVYPDGSPQPSARRRPGLRYLLAGRRSPLARLRRRPSRAAREFQYLGSEAAVEPLAVDAVVGCFMLFRRRAFEEVGGFDPGYFMFAEDIDICLRLAPRWRVYLLPFSRLVHVVGASRRRARSFTEFHRVRSLRRLFRRSHARALGPLIDLLFAGYLACLLATGLVGLGEHEHSWQMRRAGR